MDSEDMYPPKEYWNEVNREYEKSNQKATDTRDNVLLHIIYISVYAQCILSVVLSAIYVHVIVGIVAFFISVFLLYIAVPFWIRSFSDSRSIFSPDLPLYLTNPLKFAFIVHFYVMGNYFKSENTVLDRK